MYRWGSIEKHSYVLGAYSKKAKAQTEGDTEKEYRGGKYDPEITEWEVDFNKKNSQ
jgi:hypothetical protein